MARQTAARRLAVRNFQYSLEFDGTADSASTSAVNTGLTGSQACALGGWFQVRDLPANTKVLIVGGDVSAFEAGQGPFLVVRERTATGGGFNSGFFGLENTDFGYPVQDEWVFLAMRYAGGVGGELKFYLNNVMLLDTVATADMISAPVAFNTLVGLEGNFRTAEFFAYTDAITEAQLLDIYYESKYTSTNLFDWWRPLEGSGTTVTGQVNGRIINLGTSVAWSTNVPFKARTTATARSVAGDRALVV